MYLSVKDLEIGNDTAERIKHRIEYQSLQRGLFITLRMGYALYYGIQYLFNAQARTTGGTNNLTGITTEQFDDFIFYFLGHG